jgi:thioredoxin-dependent peroxiredoxin
VILGASFDSVDKNRAFAEKLCYPFKLLSDPAKTALGEPYDAIDPDDPDWPRRISYLIGPDRRVVKAYATVKPATHAAEVLADLP